MIIKLDFWLGVAFMLLCLGILGFGLDEGHDMVAEDCDELGVFENNGVVYQCARAEKGQTQ